MMLSEAFGLPPDHDRVPTEIASRFDTPTKADAYAADIVEWCRWAALPPAERLEAAREWWAASQGDHADDARAYLTALPAEQRATMEAQWLDGLPAYVGNCLWLAWRWHHKPETDAAVLLSRPVAPVRPSLVVATAAVLALVARWDDKGRPVPKQAIREILGLPSYDNLPAFLAAARLDAEAARRGAAMTDKELAGLVGVTSMSIRNWRPDFGRFANSAPDHFFPLGLEGLPDAPATMSPDDIEAECAAIADEVKAEREARADDGNRRRRQMKAKPAKPRAGLFKAAVVIARNGWPVSDVFLRAMATMLDLVSASNGRPLIAPAVLKGLGVPANVKDMARFRDAARRDGEALRDHIATMEVEGQTFSAAWADSKDDKARSGELRDLFSAMVSRTLDDGWLTKGKATLTPAVLSLDVDMGENGRSTLRDDWRPLPEYRRLVHTAAMADIMTEAIWRAAPKP